MTARVNLPLAAWVLALGCAHEVSPRAAPAATPAPTAKPATGQLTCERWLKLESLPLAPATQCWLASDEPKAAPGDATSAALVALAKAGGTDYDEQRAALLRRGKSALPKLRELTGSGRSARERALAKALVLRIEQPQEAQRLDAFAPSPEARMQRNPFPRAASEMRALFASHPELAFEALVRARDASDSSPPHHALLPAGESPLFEIVAKGPEGGALLSELAPRFPRAFAQWTEIDAEAATCGAIAWLDGKLPDPGDVQGLAVLSQLAGNDPLARHLRKRALREGSADQKLAAARAADQARDRNAVPELLAGLGETALHSAFREHLVSILGTKELESNLDHLGRECQPELRRAAALTSRHGNSPAAAKRLSMLGADADPRVRSAALESIAWLALRRDAPEKGFDDDLLRSVVRATADAEPGVRRAALDALWRLVVEKRRELTPELASAWARALSDRDDKCRAIALSHLDDFFGPDAALVLVLLAELKRVPDEWPYRERVAAARKSVGVLSREQVSEFGKRSGPELAAVAHAWLAR